MQMSYNNNNNINLKTILTYQETHQIPFETIPNPVSLQLVKISRIFLFPKFSLSNERLLWKRNSKFCWLLLLLHNNLIQSRSVVECFLGTLYSFCTFGPCSEVHDKYFFSHFLYSN